MSTNKTWFVTGTSKGFGRLWAEAALRRGDRVAATARSLDSLRPLQNAYGDAVLPLQLDVTDRAGAFAAVRRTAEHFGSLDVVVNNAGYGHFGMVEELTEADIRAQLETNFFGALWVTQAALPILRAQGSGHLVQVTSEGGVIAYPGIGAYHASKWALEGLSSSLAQEVESFGVHLTLLEPGPYSTEWLEAGARRSAPNPDYDDVRKASEQEWVRGDPAATADAVLELVDLPDPPLRMHFGRSLSGIIAEYERRLQTWRAYEDLSVRAFGNPT